jgi:hypothetical protein
MLPQKLDPLRIDVGVRHRLEPEQIAIAQEDGAPSGAAQFHRGSRQRFQHRLQIEYRPTDDPEHIGGRGLLLQRLAEIAGLRLHLIEQADVADSDYRLVGERLKQGNLFVAERVHFGTAEDDRPDALILAQQRHAQNAAMAHAARQFAAVGEVGAFVG